MTDSFRDLITILFVAILLVYIVLAAQFESTSMPLIILFALPFAFSGVVLALLITGNTLSVNAMLGAIMLVGIAVKNSIILVDYTNLLRDRGMRLNDAVVLGGRSRLRPILMTATTTFLGMLPMALSTGEGSELWAPIGIAVIGGLVFSTILSLFVVPVAYHTLYDLVVGVKRLCALVVNLNLLMKLLLIIKTIIIINKIYMKAIFLIHNQSVTEQINYLLERLDIKAYTKWETVIGKGTVGEPRFGTHTWPELNSALISVVDDEKVQPFLSAIHKLDKINEGAGIKAFVWDVLMSSDDVE